MIGDSSFLHLKSLTVRTPLGPLAVKLRWMLDWPRRYRHPELWDMYLEEGRLLQILDRVLRPDSSCVDVGSHIGSFLTRVLARSPQGQHVAIEPVPQKAKWLAERFPEVEVHGVATSDVNGTLIFEENIDIPAFSRLKSASNESPGGRVKHYEVKTVRLDDLLSDIKRIDLLKVDVEGNEAQTFRGAEATLGKHRPFILFECGPTTPQQDRDAVFETLSAFNYEIFTPGDFLFGKTCLSLSEFRKCGIYPFRALNLVATRN